MSNDLRSSHAVVMRDVSKYFDEGAVRALDGLSLEIDAGENVAITGPSGCGKSTMLHLLAALDVPTSGSIHIDGADLRGLDPVHHRRRRVGLVFQLHNLLPQLTALENVEVAMFGTGMSRHARRQRAGQLLADVELSAAEARPPTRLSGGERQRVAIARALANEPTLLLADEPTGNLDEQSIDKVLELFRRLRHDRPELTLLTVTHDARVEAAADRVLYLRDGRIDPSRSGLDVAPATGS